MLFNEWTGTLLNDLLVASLYRAFSLAKVNSFALAVAKDLDFDVVAFGDVTFDEKARICQSQICSLGLCSSLTFEQCFASRLHSLEALLDLLGRMADRETHAATS